MDHPDKLTGTRRTWRSKWDLLYRGFALKEHSRLDVCRNHSQHHCVAPQVAGLTRRPLTHWNTRRSPQAFYPSAFSTDQAEYADTEPAPIGVCITLDHLQTAAGKQCLDDAGMAQSAAKVVNEDHARLHQRSVIEGRGRSDTSHIWQIFSKLQMFDADNRSRSAPCRETGRNETSYLHLSFSSYTPYQHPGKIKGQFLRPYVRLRTDEYGASSLSYANRPGSAQTPVLVNSAHRSFCCRYTKQWRYRERRSSSLGFARMWAVLY